MGKLHLIQNQQRLINIFKEPPLISYRKGNTLRTFLLERGSEGQITTKCMSRVLPSPIFEPGNLRCIKLDSMLSRLSHTKRVKGDPRGSQCMSIFTSHHSPIPPFLVITQVEKALKLPSHPYLATPTTFHFLPPPYIFAPISPSSLLGISPLFV